MAVSNELLEKLVEGGSLISYKLERLDRNGEVVISNRLFDGNTERLILNFVNGQQLVIGIGCNSEPDEAVFVFE